jgi:hypothetical protein
VPKIYVLAFACMAVMGSCLPKDQTGTCNAIEGATRVDIYVSQLKTTPDYVITSPERIRQLITFANERREVFRPSLYTMPVPTVNAVLYEKDEFVGSIGAGPNFFFRSGTNWKGIRNAKGTEIADFIRLIDH